MANILVCDDDKDIVEAISIYLEQEGYTVLKAYDGVEAISALRSQPVDLLIIDIMMPKLDGIRATLKIREENPLPIIILSAKSEDADKILGLNVGADDYVTKPFSPAELTARVDALLRRMGENTPATHTGELYQPPFLLNLTNRTLEKNGERVKLTQIEYAIVKLFMENSGKALAREEILDAVWGKGYFGELKIVDVNVRRLRLKIEDDAQEPKYISTVWGFGYKWTV